MGDRGESDRDDTAWEVKKFTGNGRLRVKRILKKMRKHLVALSNLGRWEKFVLVCVQELDLEYQFRIADIVTCIERKYGVQNHGGRLNRKIFDAVKRLVNRKVIVKKGRGVYALRRDLATVSALGFPLVKEFVAFPFLDTENRRKALREAVKNHVTSSSKNKENLFPARVMVGGGIISGGVNVNTTGGSIVSSNDGNAISITDSSFVVRAHVVKPYGGWVGYYMSVSVAYYVLGFVRGIIREYLEELYGGSFVHKLDESAEAVAKSLPGARFIVGCHGRYGTSPGSFSPLTPRCEVHSYEYGVDVILPAALGDVLRNVSFIKVYIKKLRAPSMNN